MSIFIVPITIKEACVFVNQYHSHHKAPQGALFAVACARPDAEGNSLICGVALVGRPVSRIAAQDDWCAEVTRVATNRTPHACSMLYGACWRAARALGYRSLITYTLQTETGTSLKAAGWKLLGETKGGSWSRKDRPRIDKHPTQAKFKWIREQE